MDDVTLTKLICTQLGALTGWEYSEDPDYTYQADVVGVFYGAIQPSPDQAVGVRVYGVTDNDLEHLRWRRVQLRLRGAPDSPAGADVLAGLAFEALHGLSRVGGISGASRQSMAPAGADENRREERTENYIIILDNQEALS